MRMKEQGRKRRLDEGDDDDEVWLRLC